MSDHSFSFGYTLFSQRKDPSSKRGFTQRAVVLISDMHPQIEFFYQLVEILASKCLDLPPQQSSEETLRAFYETVVSEWPPRPLPSASYDSLPVFGYMLRLEMPPEEHITSF
jgi:hypothetical protein